MPAETPLGNLLTDLDLIAPERQVTTDDIVYATPDTSMGYCGIDCPDVPMPSGPGLSGPNFFPNFIGPGLGSNGFPGFSGFPQFNFSIPLRDPASDPILTRPMEPEPPRPVAIAGRFMVMFHENATEAAVRALLARYSLSIVVDESIPEERFFVLDVVAWDMPASTSLTDALVPGLVRALRDEAIVRNAVPVLVATSSQRPTAVSSNGTVAVWDWNQAQGDGNWGLKTLRIPAIWRVLSHPSLAASSSPRLAVVDIGFQPHTDLNPDELEIQTIAGEPGDPGHGNATLGIIGARGGDEEGIEGILARPAIIGVQTKVFLPTRNVTAEVGLSMTWMTAILNATYRMLKAHPDIRVVNLSLQYAWCRLYTGTDRSLIDQAAAEIAEITGNLFDDFRDRVLFVSAAGNDNGCQTAEEQRVLGPAVPASVSSPFNWLAANDPAWQRSVLVVEAHDRQGRRATTPYNVIFSNFGGTVSAPGKDVMSTGMDDGFVLTSGTSVAAPFVTAVAGVLLTIDPTLTPADLWSAIVDTAAPSADRGPPLVDPLNALLRIAPDALVLLCDTNSDGLLTRDDQTPSSPRRNAPAAASSPLDFNGDGRIADQDRPARVLGELMTDAQVFERGLAAALATAATADPP